MRRAKLTMTAAAQAAIRGDAFASEQATDALRELELATAELQRFEGER